MQKPRPSEVTKYAFDNREEPVLRVQAGEVFQVETDDALSTMIEDNSNDPAAHLMDDPHVDARSIAYPPKFNPVVSLIGIEGCQARMVLAVHIDFIDPWRYGFSGVLPGFGPYENSSQFDGQCFQARVQTIEHLPGPSGHTCPGKGVHSETRTLDLEPFCGTLATAPERGFFT